MATTLAYADSGKKRGLTYDELPVKWTKWAFAGTKGTNAIEDETGDFALAPNLQIGSRQGRLELDQQQSQAELVNEQT